MSSQERWYQQQAFQEWWYQQHVYQLMFTNPPQVSWIYARDSLGPSFYELYQQNVPTEDECIDPMLLQLSSQHPGGEGRPSGFLDHAADDGQGTGSLTSVENHVSHNPSQFLETILEIDELGSLGAAEEPVVEETNEQFFKRPEIRELASVPSTPGTPRENSPPAEIEFEEPELMVSTPMPPVSTAPSSPRSVPPPSPVPLSSVPLYTETSGVEVYRVERIIQAWGRQGGRQYLIRWEGWGQEYDSWELAANVSDDLIADFERSRLRRRLSFKRQRRQTRKWG